MPPSSAGGGLATVYTTRPGEVLPCWLCAELAQLDRASVYETEGRRFDSCIPRHPRFSPPFSLAEQRLRREMFGFEFCFTAGKVEWQALRTRSMENDPWIFLAILLGLTAVVLPTMACY